MLSTNLLTASNISANALSTNYGFFSTLSAGSIYAKFIGDGSLLTGITNGLAALPAILSTTLLSTNLLTASNISANALSTNYGFFSTISAGSIYAKFIGDGSLLINVPFNPNGTSIVPAILSTTLLSTNLLTASNISANALSTNYGFFSTLSAGTIYAKFVGDGSLLTGVVVSGGYSLPSLISTILLSATTVTASQGVFSSLSAGFMYISSLQVNSLYIGNDTGYINMGDLIATSLSTSLVTTGNVIAQTASIASLSTNYGFFSTLSAGTIYAKFVGDGSLLTGIITTNGLAALPPILSTTLLSTNLLTASNISTNALSTNYGFFSTLSSGNIQGKFIGDGSGLTNLTTSSLSLSSGNISISTITLVDTTNNSTGTIYERSSLLYFNTFVVAGASVWTSQLITGR